MELSSQNFLWRTEQKSDVILTAEEAEVQWCAVQAVDGTLHTCVPVVHNVSKYGYHTGLDQAVPNSRYRERSQNLPDVLTEGILHW